MNARQIIARAAAAALALAVSATRSAAASADDHAPLVLRAGRVYVTPDNVIENGSLLVEETRVQSVGTDVDAPEGAVVIDIPTGVITAGLIDANASADAWRNYRGVEHRSECIPELHVIDSIDLEDRHLDDLAASGVTTVYLTADPSSVIGAQGAIIRTGGRLADRVLNPAYCVKATIGREPIFRNSFNRGPFGDISFLTRRPTTRMGLVWVLRKSFHDTEMRGRGEEPATRGEGAPPESSIPILMQVLRGEVPLRIQARQQLDILTALRLSKEFSVPFILEEGTEAYRCIAELKDAAVPVIYGPLYDYPVGYRANTGEAERSRYSAPAELLKGGLTVALSAGDLTGEGGLAQQAMYAMRFGLTRTQALAAVTTTPARLLQIDGMLGTLEKGRIADAVVWSGEPFAATTRVEAVVIGGVVVWNRAER